LNGALFYATCKLLVLPPGLLAVTGVVGLLCRPFARRVGNGLVLLAIGGLWLLSTPWMSATLAAPLERHPPLDPAQLALRGVEAIVILGGGSYRDAPEFGYRDEVSRLTLERLRYGARLYRETGLDLAVTGGNPSDLDAAEAAHMATALVTDFRVPVRWAETTSHNTAENASASAARFPFRRIALVTHAMHMPRAERAFVAAGFEVTPAPMGFVSAGGRPPDDGAVGMTLFDLLPEMRALWDSHYAMYEYIGALWYALGRD